MKALITKKLGMTSIIASDGTVSPVTILYVDNNKVIGKRNTDKDGYEAIIVGAGEVKKLSKSLAGIVKESQAKPSIIKEFKIIDNSNESYSVGDSLEADIFNIGDKLSVTSISKGKGWAGTIKRHNFHRGRKTHGGRSYRRVGSIGSMYPQHIFKGKKMSGRMGHDQVTIKNIKVAYVDKPTNTIGVLGSVPGPRKSIVFLKGVN